MQENLRLTFCYFNLGFFYGINNSNADYLIRNYGAQVIGQAFYNNDNNLKQYENIFDKFQTAFIPIASYL